MHYSAIKKSKILINATTWEDLANIVISEISQTCGITDQNRQDCKDRKVTSDFKGLGRGEYGIKLLSGYRVLFGEDKNVWH